MRVLFCTDGSKISYHSIENFYYWCKDFTVDIFCAIDWSFLPDTVSVEDSEFALQCTNSADSILDYSENFLSELGMKIGKKIKMCGSTVDSILEVCDKEIYDYIVLGSHGKRGLQKWLGSVSQEIASVAKFPTYVSKDKNNRQKVLFSVDSSELSADVVRKTLEDFDLSNKDIYLVTVYEIPDYLFLEGNLDSNWILDIQKKQEKVAMALLDDFEQIFNSAGLSVKNKIILNGAPAIEVVKFIEQNDIDLSVCGIRNRKNLPKFLISSVSKKILEMAKSDVLIIRL